MSKTGRLEQLYSPEDIHKFVMHMAAEIRVAYPRPPVMVTVLKGSLFFAADLARALGWTDLVMDFVKLASYSGTKSTGTVHILQDLSVNITGEDVLIVEEIVDTGRTLDFFIKRLKASNPRSIKIAALFDKEVKREIPVPVDFIGKKVDDLFLIGYGLDLDEKYRALPGVYIYHPDDKA